MALLTTPARPRPQFHPLEVERVERLTPWAVAVTFAVPDELAGVFLRYRAGQYVTLRSEIGGEDVRQSYSICQSPARSRATGTLRVGIGRVDGGRMSTWADEALAAGETVHVLPPMGELVLPAAPAEPREVVLVGAGTGITPLLAIAHDVLEGEPGSTVRLVLGNRTWESVMFLDELEALAAEHPDRFTLIHVLSREEPQEAGPRGAFVPGRLDPERVRVLLGPAAADLPRTHCLCGPVAVVDSVHRTLVEDLGVPPERVLREVFDA